MLFQIRCSLRHSLYDAFLYRLCKCGQQTAHALVTHQIYTYAPHTSQDFLFHSQYLHGTIFVTLHSIVWDWWVVELGQCFYYFIIIIIIKKDWQCKAGRGRLTPYQSKDHSPTLQTYRGKEKKGKIVEDKKGESN